MKLRELQNLDQNIIKMLADHKGIDRAIRGEVLAQSLNIPFVRLLKDYSYF